MLAPQSNVDLNEQVYMPELLIRGGLARDLAHAVAEIGHGRVRIEEWCIGIPHTTLPRWVLRGVTISVGERSISTSDDGTKIHRERKTSLVA